MIRMRKKPFGGFAKPGHSSAMGGFATPGHSSFFDFLWICLDIYVLVIVPPTHSKNIHAQEAAQRATSTNGGPLACAGHWPVLPDGFFSNLWGSRNNYSRLQVPTALCTPRKQFPSSPQPPAGPPSLAQASMSSNGSFWLVPTSPSGLASTPGNTQRPPTRSQQIPAPPAALETRFWYHNAFGMFLKVCSGYNVLDTMSWNDVPKLVAQC